MERYELGSREYNQTIIKDPASTFWCNSQCVSCFVAACRLASLIFCVELKTRIVSPFCSSSIVPPQIHSHYISCAECPPRWSTTVIQVLESYQSNFHHYMYSYLSSFSGQVIYSSLAYHGTCPFCFNRPCYRYLSSILSFLLLNKEDKI